MSGKNAEGFGVSEVIVIGPDGATPAFDATVEGAVASVAFTKVQIVPSLDTSIYASGDSLHTAVLEFPDAVAAGGGAYVESMVIVDGAAQSQPCELWLFDQTVTPAAANAAHSISDIDAAKCLGVISSGVYYASALNSVSVAKGVSLPVKAAGTGTSLFGILVTRGTPTYAASSLTVSLILSRVG